MTESVGVKNAGEWPQTDDPATKELMLKEYREHPEKYCIGGGNLHRMILIHDATREDAVWRESEQVRGCLDCGITTSMRMKFQRRE